MCHQSTVVVESFPEAADIVATARKKKTYNGFTLHMSKCMAKKAGAFYGSEISKVRAAQVTQPGESSEQSRSRVWSEAIASWARSPETQQAVATDHVQFIFSYSFTVLVLFIVSLCLCLCLCLLCLCFAALLPLAVAIADFSCLALPVCKNVRP